MTSHRWQTSSGLSSIQWSLWSGTTYCLFICSNPCGRGRTIYTISGAELEDLFASQTEAFWSTLQLCHVHSACYIRLSSIFGFGTYPWTNLTVPVIYGRGATRDMDIFDNCFRSRCHSDDWKPMLPKWMARSKQQHHSSNSLNGFCSRAATDCLSEVAKQDRGYKRYDLVSLAQLI